MLDFEEIALSLVKGRKQRPHLWCGESERSSGGGSWEWSGVCVCFGEEGEKMGDVAEVELKEKTMEGEKEKGVVATEEKLVKAAPGLFGISYASWASVVAFLFLLWVFVALFFWLLINVAVKMRSNDYKGTTFSTPCTNARTHSVHKKIKHDEILRAYRINQARGSFCLVRSLFRRIYIFFSRMCWYCIAVVCQRKGRSRVPWSLLIFVDASACWKRYMHCLFFLMNHTCGKYDSRQAPSLSLPLSLSLVPCV